MISKTFYRHVHQLRSAASLSVTRVDPVKRLITIQWSDGISGTFPMVWLRDNSHDSKTYSIGPAMKARNLTMNTFDVEQIADSVHEENGNLVIEWQDGYQTSYSSDFLRFRNPSDEQKRKLRRKVYLFPEKTWGKKEIERDLKKFDHEAVLRDDKTLHDFLEAVCLDGIAVIKNGRQGDRQAVEDIGNRIGLIHNTHFGKVFEVSTKPDASNMAYASNGGLPFHTDFPSLAHPPQLQMLHMIERAEEGGNSLFVDGFHVAEQLRVERPDVFKILSTQSMEFIEEGYDIHDGPDGKPKCFDYDMCARHKVIRLDDNGRVNKIQFGNAMRSWFYDCDPENVQDLYRAMKVFTDYCYQDRNILKFQLENGDTALWANTRLLHTRDAFRNAPGKGRTLMGCYFAWDFVKSRVRVLRDRLQLEQNQPSI